MNRPTEMVDLWIQHDEYLLERVTEIVIDADGDTYVAKMDVMEFMEGEAEATVPGVYQSSYVADLFQWAMEHVDWEDIVDTIQSGIEVEV